MLNPPQHTQVRRAAGNTFDRKSLDVAKESAGIATAQLVDQLAEELKCGEAQFCSTVSEELPVRVAGGWLNIPPSDYPLMRSPTHD